MKTRTRYRKTARPGRITAARRGARASKARAPRLAAPTEGAIQRAVRPAPPSPPHYELRPGDIIVELPVPEVQPTNAPPPKASAQETRYRILEKLSEEKSFGNSYRARPIDQSEADDDVFIKTPRITKDIPYADLDRLLSETFASFIAEYQSRGRIEELNSNRSEMVAAPIKGFGLYKVSAPGARELIVPFLVQAFIPQQNMVKFLRQEYGVPPSGEFTGIRTPRQWFDLAKKIVDIVRRVHNRSVMHGAIDPRNILLKRDRKGNIHPIVVDFGQSFRLDVSSAGATIRRDNMYVAPECRDADLGWYTPADIYSLGGVLYYLATGCHPPDIMAQRQIFSGRHSWANANQEQVDAWKDLIHWGSGTEGDRGCSANEDLMRTNEGIVKVIDKCLRPNPSDRYSSAEKLLQALNAVDYEGTAGKKVDRALAELVERMRKAPVDRWDRVFQSIVTDNLELISKQIENISNRHLEIYADREDLIDELVKYIGVLRTGDTYVTVTVPEYWTEHNLGVKGRFLTVNKDLARNGVNVNRLFLLCPEDLSDPLAQRILRAHLEAWEKLPAENRSTSPFEGRGRFYVGYLMLEDREEVRRLQARSHHVAIWARGGASGTKMSIRFDSRPVYGAVPGTPRVVQTGTQIVKVRFRQLDGTSEYEDLETHLRSPRARPLEMLKERLVAPAPSPAAANTGD